MINTINIDKSFSTTKSLLSGKSTVLTKKENNLISNSGGLSTIGYLKKSYENKPLVSIITVVYNGEKYIKETIESVINQTYNNIEYIIIDGGSKDRTIDIIKSYENVIDYWISEKDNGIYDAMNKGIKLCKGEIIGLINADDWYELNTIKLIVENYLLSDKEKVLHGYINVITDNYDSYISENIKNMKILKKGMILNHPTVFVPNKLYEKYGLFSTKYKIASDWELMLRFYLSNVGFIEIKNVLTNFRLGGASFVIDKKLIEEKHNIRKQHKIYKFIDEYYLIDLLKLFFFRKYVAKISLFKQALFKNQKGKKC